MRKFLKLSIVLGKYAVSVEVRKKEGIMCKCQKRVSILENYGIFKPLQWKNQVKEISKSFSSSI